MTQTTERIPIGLGARSYEILVGNGLLGQRSSFDGLPSGGPAVVVSNPLVGGLYGERLVAALEPRYSRVIRIDLPEGEAHKDWATLSLIFDALLGGDCDRSTTLFALGGGVIGDMTGFAAACYMRGVSYVQLPTTLLAQVDSSVGGKTGINHPRGKNMIGAFHQPIRVVADLDTLGSLPQRELVAGMAEVIKYGPIADAAFLDWIEANLAALLARDGSALAFAINRSCRIKAAVVSADERESGLRAILNFGHTFGHAIDAGLGFGTWLHGEAVGCGMVMAGNLSARLGLIGKSDAARLSALVGRAGLPIRPPALETRQFIDLMRLDKKSDAGDMRFVLLEGAGKAGLHRVDETFVAQFIDAMRAA